MMDSAASSSPSPYTSLGDRPEMELDLWEGQFSLQPADTEAAELQLSPDLEPGAAMYRSGSTQWGQDSEVTMGTVQQLQDTVGRLQDVHDDDEVRYHHVKQDNDSLAKKVFILEEIIRDMEVTGLSVARDHDQKLQELQRRLQLREERVLELELDNATLAEESLELKRKLSEMVVIKEKLTEEDIGEEHKLAQVKCYEDTNHCVEEAFDPTFSRLDKSETDSGCHLQDSEELVSELQARLAEMEGELRVARDQYTCLLEQNKQDEQISQYEQNDKSLDQELRESSQQHRQSFETEIQELKKSLRKQEEVNAEQQKYIDSVILNIMDKHPELLEVRK